MTLVKMSKSIKKKTGIQVIKIIVDKEFESYHTLLRTYLLKFQFNQISE